eukprot:scaffold1334_cov344-Prasinococcus_capsulatus_cf.AAC.18
MRGRYAVSDVAQRPPRAEAETTMMPAAAAPADARACFAAYEAAFGHLGALYGRAVRCVAHPRKPERGVRSCAG